MKTPGNRGNQAFTMVEMGVVVGIIGLLVMLAVPNFIKARSNSQVNSCIENLRQIDAAKQQWSLELRTPTITPQLTDIQTFLGRGGTNKPACCPADSSQTFATSYSIGSMQTNPACLILPATHTLN